MKKILSFFAILVVLSIYAASLMAQTPQYYNSNTGTSSNYYPFGYSSGKAVTWLFRSNEIVLPTPIPTGKKINRVYVRTVYTRQSTLNNLMILFAQSTITDLTPGTFYPGPWDTVYNHASATLTGTQNTWMNITLDKAFNYDPSKSLIVFVGQCSSTGAGIAIWQTVLPGIRRVMSVGGCPYTPYASGDGFTADFGVDVIDAVGVIPDGKATQDNLIQNFPNPFINSTKISYQLKENTDVVLKVFDIMGKEVSTLVNKSQTAGNYEVAFDASNLPSGIYVYQLTTSNNSISKRMVIEK